jgi:hypothetical protein
MEKDDRAGKNGVVPNPDGTAEILLLDVRISRGATRTSAWEG